MGNSILLHCFKSNSTCTHIDALNMSKGILVHATLLGPQILFDICVTTRIHMDVWVLWSIGDLLDYVYVRHIQYILLKRWFPTKENVNHRSRNLATCVEAFPIWFGLQPQLLALPFLEWKILGLCDLTWPSPYNLSRSRAHQIKKNERK